MKNIDRMLITAKRELLYRQQFYLGMIERGNDDNYFAHADFWDGSSLERRTSVHPTLAAAIQYMEDLAQQSVNDDPQILIDDI